jgi:hypothetical protein
MRPPGHRSSRALLATTDPLLFAIREGPILYRRGSESSDGTLG